MTPSHRSRSTSGVQPWWRANSTSNAVTTPWSLTPALAISTICPPVMTKLIVSVRHDDRITCNRSQQRLIKGPRAPRGVLEECKVEVLFSRQACAGQDQGGRHRPRGPDTV